jgi:hypothetical protein
MSNSKETSSEKILLKLYKVFVFFIFCSVCVCSVKVVKTYTIENDLKIERKSIVKDLDKEKDILSFNKYLLTNSKLSEESKNVLESNNNSIKESVMMKGELIESIDESQSNNMNNKKFYLFNEILLILLLIHYLDQIDLIEEKT